MIHLGSIGKTSIDIDLSFLILIAFFVAMNYNRDQGIQYALVWVPVLFLSVLIHELAHAGMIAAFGYGSSQIILGGMGGVTVNRRNARPWQDMLISVAGPFSSFALMLGCAWLSANVMAVHTDAMLSALVPRMQWANLAWGLFNLIPVPPLDGGHAVRDFFRIFLTERRAFAVSIWIAIIVGGAVSAWMLVRGQIFIAIFIAWFVYVAFQQWIYFRDHGVSGD